MRHIISRKSESVHKPRTAFAIILSLAFLMGASLTLVEPARAQDLGDSPVLTVTVYEFDSNDIHLDWEVPQGMLLGHSEIYREELQTDFDLNANPWIDTRYDLNPLYGRIMLTTTEWLDENANLPGHNNYKEQYYYIVRVYAPATMGGSPTSNVAGKWTHTFGENKNTFSLPFEYYPWVDYSQPNWVDTVGEYLQDMGAAQIEYMENGQWKSVPGNGDPGKKVVLGDGYTATFLLGTFEYYYTFAGLPGAQLDYDESDAPSFSPGSPDYTARLIDADVNGRDVTINWDSIGADEYCVYYSVTRVGPFGTEGIDFRRVDPCVSNSPITHYDVAYPGTELYYWVRPRSNIGGELLYGAPTYTIGVWTQDFEEGSETMGLPLKPYEGYQYTYYWVSYYADNIPSCVGIAWWQYNGQVWIFHATEMPPGVYDTEMTMIMGVQPSLDAPSYFSHVGM